MMNLSRKEIEQYLKQFEAGELTEDQFFQQQALDNIDPDFNLPSVVSLAAAGLGFALLGPLGAIGGAVAGGSLLWGRYRRSHDQQLLIREGNQGAIQSALPPELKIAYSADRVKKAETPTGPPVATTPPPITKAVAIAPSPTETPTAPPVATTPPPITKPVAIAPPSTDTAQKIAAAGLRCWLFIGASGTGKSLLATTTAKRIKATTPTTQLWAISAKCDGGESGYWSGFDRLSFYDFVGGDFTVKAKAYGAWINLIQDFKRLEQPSLLILDELSLMMCEVGGVERQGYKVASQFRDEFCSVMSSFASAGRSGNKAVWGISPVGALNGLGKLSKAQIAAFNPVFNAQLSSGSPGFHQGTWKDAAQNGLAPASPPTPEQETECNRLGCSLLTGINGRWLPTQRYEAPTPDPEVVKHFCWGLPKRPLELAPKPDPKPEKVRDQIRAGIEQGKGKTELLKELGLKPGGNQAWQDASAIFDEVKDG